MSEVDPKVAKQLARLRKKIDQADHKVLAAMAKRFQTVVEIDRLKKSAGMLAFQKSRWNIVVRERVAYAKHIGLSPSFVHALLELVHGESLRIQSSGKNSKKLLRKKI
jgi:chorismate mutase